MVIVPVSVRQANRQMTVLACSCLCGPKCRLGEQPPVTKEHVQLPDGAAGGGHPWHAAPDAATAP